jgi:hypothetical protein
MKRFINIVILVTGVALLIEGFNEYGTFGARAGRFLGVSISDRVLLLFLAGAACTVYGLMKGALRK